MQFDPQRAFPHPVLRPDVNDYVDGEFQAIVDFTHSGDSPEIGFEAQFALSVDELSALLADGVAHFVVVISCRETYFRHVIATADHIHRCAFLAGDFRGEVQINAYVIAVRPIKSFSCGLINQEFGVGPFAFEEGSVLALDEPRAVYVDRDLFKPVTSVFELVKNENISNSEWHLNCSGDRVQISVSPSMKEKIDTFRNSSRNRAILLNSVYFGAVMQCIRHLKLGNEYDSYRWATVIRQQCHNNNINLSLHDEYLIAERLMKLPLSLLDAYVFTGGCE